MNVSSGHISLLEAESKQSLAYGIFISFTTIAFLFVSLRLATRILIIRNPGAEDVLIGAAMVKMPTLIQFSQWTLTLFRPHPLPWRLVW